MEVSVSRRTRSKRRSHPRYSESGVHAATNGIVTPNALPESPVVFSADEEDGGGDISRTRDTRTNNGQTPRDIEEKIVEARSPLTPVHNLVSNLRQRLEKQLNASLSGSLTNISQTECKTSPGLSQLRNTPVKGVLQRQRQLEKKHLQARSRSDSVSIGGGVSMWPEMDNMRLTRTETCTLIATSISLGAVTIAVFFYMHGKLWENLQLYSSRASRFYQSTELSMADQKSFDSSVLHWHGSFSKIMSDIESTFSVSLGHSPVSYQISVLLYCGGISVLLYYLADNVFAKSKLTPNRIKIWVSLLVVVGLWTVLALGLLVYAQQLENSVEKVVHNFSERLTDLVYTDHDLTTYHNVLLVWRTRCLPPTTRGTLSILGLVQVRDVAHYLQYYSLPVLTALVTPIVKLIISLKEVYSVKVHPS